MSSVGVRRTPHLVVRGLLGSLVRPQDGLCLFPNATQSKCRWVRLVDDPQEGGEE